MTNEQHQSRNIAMSQQNELLMRHKRKTRRKINNFASNSDNLLINTSTIKLSKSTNEKQITNDKNRLKFNKRLINNGLFKFGFMTTLFMLLLIILVITINNNDNQKSSSSSSSIVDAARAASGTASGAEKTKQQINWKSKYRYEVVEPDEPEVDKSKVDDDDNEGDDDDDDDKSNNDDNEDDNNHDDNDNDNDDDNDEIEEIEDAETLNDLIASNDHLLVFFYDREDEKVSAKANEILEKLETIDDECDEYGIDFVKIDNDALARSFGLHDELPALVYFEHQMPSIYEGPYDHASSVLQWIVTQNSQDTIEEVTEEMLERLISTNPYVLVFFAPDSCKSECDKILIELENIDDDTDDNGIVFVTTDDIELARKRTKVNKFPALILFRGGHKGDFKHYKGPLNDHQKILDWVLDEETLDNPNQVETINGKMFWKMITSDKNSAVLALIMPSNTPKSSGSTPSACKLCDKYLLALEQIDHLLEKDKNVDVVRVIDSELVKKFGSLIGQNEPKLILFQNRMPHIYSPPSASISSSSIQSWVNEKLNAVEKGEAIIEQVNGQILDLMQLTLDHFVVLFYKDSRSTSLTRILEELEKIDDDTDEHGIQFVKSNDLEWAQKHDLITSNSDDLQEPLLVYFERNKVPSIYDVGANLEDEHHVLEWLVEQKNDDTIENVNRGMLANMISKTNYVACVFYKNRAHRASDTLLSTLEHIDDDVGELGVHLVKINDEQLARSKPLSIKGQLPALVLYRQGEPLVYELTGDDLARESREKLVEWMTKPENLELHHSIELINEKMFQHYLSNVNVQKLAVLFYTSKRQCKQCEKILEAMEQIDDEAHEAGIRFVKLDSIEVARRYEINKLPSLVLFKRKSSSLSKSSGGDSHEILRYTGDMDNSDSILSWLLAKPKTKKSAQKEEKKATSIGKQLKTKQTTSDNKRTATSGKKELKLVGGKELLKMIQDGMDDDPDDPDGNDNDDDVDQDDDDDDDIKKAVLVHSSGKCDSHCTTAIETLESIIKSQDPSLDDLEFVRTTDKSIVRQLGLDTLPALVYLEHDEAPTIYQGDLYRRDQVFEWLRHQTNDDTIEDVNRHILEQLIESNDYLVVLFYKQHCKACTTAVEKLELIDDDCDLMGIRMVKINDIALARRYGIKTFPSLVYFRNGNPLIYDRNDLHDEEEILEWLTSDEARDIDDEIESVNGRMLDKLIDSSPFLAVLFYSEQGCKQCDDIIAELEKIDDDTDLYGIDFVKTTDQQAARKWRIKKFPTLVYFRKHVPSYYEGDLLDEESVLRWLTSADAFTLQDEIEEVNRRMLDKLLETHDYIAVFFYEKNCDKCERTIKELEHIDDEADSLDIMFVKIRDPTCAKKYGITHFPTLVYFRKKFPSIYRGDLMKEEKVLEWLRKNRYRNPELNLFMYALFGITVSFIIYTVYVMCSKRKHHHD